MTAKHNEVAWVVVAKAMERIPNAHGLRTSSFLDVMENGHEWTSPMNVRVKMDPILFSSSLLLVKLESREKKRNIYFFAVI